MPTSSMENRQEGSTYLAMLNNIATDLDLLLNDLCQTYPYPEATTFECVNQNGTERKNLRHGNFREIDDGTSTDSGSSEQRNLAKSFHAKKKKASVAAEDTQTKQSWTSTTAVPMPQVLDKKPREISFLERLTKSHPIWFLPDIGRFGAVHLLKDKKPGTFIVRKSRRHDAMALSVLLPKEEGSTVEHYLIEATSQGLHLQGSNQFFLAIPDLIANYCQNINELPRKLVLPEPILLAKTSQELASMALLGQDFWTSLVINNQKRTIPPLQKSSSEPTNVTRSGEFDKCLMNIKNSLPSHSYSCDPLLSSFAARSKQAEHLDPTVSSNNSATISMIGSDGHPNKLKAGSNSDPNLPFLHLPGEHNKEVKNDNEEEDSKDDAVFHHSNTHPRTSKQKSSLYSTTSLDLLINTPPSAYFKSNLSDKLSDYEDIWKNLPVGRAEIFDKQKIVHEQQSKNGNIENKNDVINHEDQRDSKAVLFNFVKEEPATTSTLQTEPGTEFAQEASLKTKPPPLPNLAHVKESHLVSPAKVRSPVYMEPFDSLDANSAVLPNRNQLNKMLLRSRRKHRTGSAHDWRLLYRISHNPKLETIFSPSATEDGTQFSFDKFGLEIKNNHTELLKICRNVCRSQSLKMPSHSKDNHDTFLHKGMDRLSLYSENKDTAHNRNNQKLHLHIPQGHCQKNVCKGIGHSLCETETNTVMKDMQAKEIPISPTLNKFPVYSKHGKSTRTSCSESFTLGDVISCESPELTLKPITPLTNEPIQRVSEYDNINYYPISTISDAGTVFSKPWDSSKWENLLSSQNLKLLPPVDIQERIVAWQKSSQVYDSTSSNLDNAMRHSKAALDLTTQTHDLVQDPPSISISRPLSVVDAPEKTGLPDQDSNKLLVPDEGGYLPSSRCRFGNQNSKEVALQKTVSTAQTKASHPRNPGTNVRDYIFRLSQNGETIFGSSIENFIQCTLESQETNPNHVMRNVRQFMTGIKNYLVKNAEGGLDKLIEEERNKLGFDEILNIDSIIEGALHVCIIQPLKHHLYKLLVKEYKSNGSLLAVSCNIKFARTRSTEELGLRAGLSLPERCDVELIKHYLNKMQRAYSPLKKLENLLDATHCITACLNNQGSCQDGKGSSVGADDFLPMLIYVIVEVGLVSAEIEADYMWGLLHPTLLTGEGGYYLSTLSSAVLLLRNFRDMHLNKNSKERLASISDMQGFLKVAFPDELHGSIIWKTLPVRPNMTTRDVCAMIAHKFKITNPQDYGLYMLINGKETLLTEQICPQAIKSENLRLEMVCVFAYKRTAANIAWPKSIRQP